MENNRIVPMKPIHDRELRKEIEDFKFFGNNMATLKILMIIKMVTFHNPNVPSYSAKYQL